MDRKRFRRLPAGGLAALLAVWIVVAGRVLVATHAPLRVDAVFVLSGYKHGERVRAAVMVFAKTGASRLVILRAPREPARAEMLKFASGLGADPAAIRFVNGVHSTSDEASLAAGLIVRCGWRSVAVVTSPFHTRRAGFLFRRAVRGAATISMVATSEPFHPGLWWTRRDDATKVFLEWAKGIASLGKLVAAPGIRDPETDC